MNALGDLQKTKLENHRVCHLNRQGEGRGRNVKYYQGDAVFFSVFGFALRVQYWRGLGG